MHQCASGVWLRVSVLYFYAMTVGRKRVFYGFLLRHPWRWHLLNRIPVSSSLAPHHHPHRTLPTSSPRFLAPFLPRSLPLSVNHLPFSCVSSFPIHLSQSSSSILLSVPTNLPLLASEHFLCPLSSSLYITLPLYPLPVPRLFSPSEWYSNGALCHRGHFGIILQSGSVYSWKSNTRVQKCREEIFRVYSLREKDLQMYRWSKSWCVQA